MYYTTYSSRRRLSKKGDQEGNSTACIPNRRNRLAWCRGKLYLPVIGYWDRVVFSDESKVEIGANKRVYIEEVWSNGLGMYFIQRSGHFGIWRRNSQRSGVSGYIG